MEQNIYVVMLKYCKYYLPSSQHMIVIAFQRLDVFQCHPYLKLAVSVCLSVCLSVSLSVSQVLSFHNFRYYLLHCFKLILMLKKKG